MSALNLIAGQEYIFDRITLAADNRGAKDNRDALDWRRHRSSFRVLNWDGAREARAHWRNYRESRSDADLYAHVFEGARWMSEANSFQLTLLDAGGAAIGAPLELTVKDFLNQLKQQDFDMIKAEYRYENFTRHNDRSSAKVKRAVVQSSSAGRPISPSVSSFLATLIHYASCGTRNRRDLRTFRFASPQRRSTMTAASSKSKSNRTSLSTIPATPSQRHEYLFVTRGDAPYKSIEDVRSAGTAPIGSLRTKKSP